MYQTVKILINYCERQIVETKRINPDYLQCLKRVISTLKELARFW